MSWLSSSVAFACIIVSHCGNDFFPKELRSSMVMPTHPIQHEFTSPSNETIISVEAEHKPGVLSVDAIRNTTSITCTSTDITLSFPTLGQAENFHKVATEQATLVTASTLVGCPKSSVRFLTGVSLVGSQVGLQTKPATLLDALRSVKVSAQLQPAELQAVANSCDRLKILDGDCTALVNTSHSYTISKDYSGTTLYQAGPVTLKCASCKVSLTTSLQFMLQVTDNTLQYAGMVGGGTVEIDVGATITVHEKYSKSWTKVLKKWSLPGVTFFLGAVPIDLVLEPEVDTYGGFGVNGTLTATIQSTVTASHHSGLMWYRTGGWIPVNQTKWSPILTNRSVAGTIGADAYNGLLIGFSAVIDDIFTLTLAADAGLYMSAETFSGFNYSGYVGLCEHIRLVADLGITLFDIHIGPHKTWTIKNLYMHCTFLWKGYGSQAQTSLLEDRHIDTLAMQHKDPY